MASENVNLESLQKILGELLDLPADVLTPDAHLQDDLGLDSIDAIDMVVLLEKETGCKLSMEELKDIQTIQDVLDQIERMGSEKNE